MLAVGVAMGSRFREEDGKWNTSFKGLEREE